MTSLFQAFVFLGVLCSASVYGQTTGASDGHTLVMSDAEEDGRSSAQKTSDYNSNRHKYRFQYKLLAGVNATLGNRVAKQLEYELRLSASDPNRTDVDILPARSKVGLAVIHALGLSCCGVDRCFMGQACLGVLKGLTLGGLLVWAIVDGIAIIINMLSKDLTMDSVGMKAKWAQADLDTAFWICVVGLLWHACCSGSGSKAASQGASQGDANSQCS